jgi:integrase
MSTGKTDRAEAEEHARHILAIHSAGKDAEAIREVATALAEKLTRDGAAKAGHALTFADARERMPLIKANGAPKKPSTLESAHLAWDCFSAAMTAAGCRTIGAVPPVTARAWLMEQKPRWRQVLYISIRQIYQACGVPHPLGDPPRRPSTDVQHREALTMDQTLELIDAARHAATRRDNRRISSEYPLFIRFLVYTGLRLGDAATATPAQIDWTTGVISRKMAKTYHEVTLPLPEKLLKDLPRSGEYLFPEIARIYLSGTGAVGKAIRRLMRRIGIIGQPQEYCGHCLRTTFAAMCAENNVPLAVIQSWLGHESQEVTRIYARIEDIKRKREALSRLPEI